MKRVLSIITFCSLFSTTVFAQSKPTPSKHVQEVIDQQMRERVAKEKTVLKFIHFRPYKRDYDTIHVDGTNCIYYNAHFLIENYSDDTSTIGEIDTFVKTFTSSDAFSREIKASNLFFFREPIHPSPDPNSYTLDLIYQCRYEEKKILNKTKVENGKMTFQFDPTRNAFPNQ